MAADTVDVRMAKLEEAYEQVTKRLDDSMESLGQDDTSDQTGSF